MLQADHVLVPLVLFDRFKIRFEPYLMRFECIKVAKPFRIAPLVA